MRYVSILIIILLASCSASVGDDAKKAADLTRQSLEYTVKKEFDKAEKTFEQAKLIRDKYKESPDEFYQLYTEYLEN